MSDQFGFTSEAGQFHVAKRNESWPCSRLLAGGACTHVAGRSLAAILLVLGDRRSLAPYCCCLAREQRLVGYCCLAGRSLAAFFESCFSLARLYFPVSSVCVRQNAMEWNGSLRRWNGMERSGWKVMSPASGAGETVPILGESGVVRCLHLSTTKHKQRLGEAGVSGIKKIPTIPDWKISC